MIMVMAIISRTIVGVHGLNASTSENLPQSQYYTLLTQFLGLHPTCTKQSGYLFIPHGTIVDCVIYQDSPNVKDCFLPTHCGHKFVRAAGPLSTQSYVCYGIGLNVPARALPQYLMDLSHLYPFERCQFPHTYEGKLPTTIDRRCRTTSYFTTPKLPAFYKVLIEGNQYHIPEGLLSQYTMVTYSQNSYMVIEGTNAIVNTDKGVCYYTMAASDYMAAAFGYSFNRPHFVYYSNRSEFSLTHYDIRNTKTCMQIILRKVPTLELPHDVFISPTKVIIATGQLVDSDIKYFQWCYPSFVPPPADTFTYAIYKGILFTVSYLFQRFKMLISYILYSALDGIQHLNSRFLLFEFVVAYLLLRTGFPTDVTVVIMIILAIIMGVTRELEPRILSLESTGCKYRGPPTSNRVTGPSEYCNV